MNRLLSAALAACFAVAHAAMASGSYVFIPSFQPGPYQLNLEVGSYKNIYKVAILSGIGRNFHLVYSKSFFPSESTVDISAWGLDDIIRDTLHTYLGTRFTFVDVPYDTAKLGQMGSRFWHSSQLTEFLKTIPNQDIDAFIVLLPNTQGAVELEQRTDRPMLRVLYEMDVIDAHTHKVISRADAHVQFLKDYHPILPSIIISDEYTLDAKVTLSPEKLEKLKGFTTRVLKSSLIDTIRALQFGVPLPPVADPSLRPTPLP